MACTLHRFIFATVIGISVPQLAYAQGATSPATAKQAARAAADKGFELFQAGKFEAAIQAFEDAEKNFHAPTILLMIARANDKLGRLVQSRKVYQQIIDEKLAHYAPPEFFQAQATAKKETDALISRIPSLRVVVSGSGAQQAKITVDGHSVEMSSPVPVDPGEHEVVVHAKDRDAETRTVTVKEGAAEEVTFTITAPTSTVVPPDGSADNGSSKGSLLPAAIAFGVGGLGLGIGVITGAMTLGKVGTLEDSCPNARCPQDQEDTFNSAHTLATVSTIGFVVGGVGAAAGVVLFVLRPFGKSNQTQTGMLLKPGWIGVQGGF